MGSARVAKLTLALYFRVALSDSELLTKVSLTDVDPLAVCGDLSPAAYYWSAANTSSNLWIVDLEGGGWCYSNESCSERCPSGGTGVLCSSKTYSDTLNTTAVGMSGLFHPMLDPILDGANKVFVPYCTSDGHMGDKEAFGRQFRGARVIRAVFQDLVRRHGLGRNKNQRVIFGGQSAGGRGAMVHLDYVPEMMGAIAARNVEVVGLLDSPLWIDIPPYSKGGWVGFATTCQGVFDNFGVKHLGRECLAAHPRVEDHWKCIMGQYRMPHVQTPYIIVASQYDAFQLGMNNISLGTADDEAVAYAEDFANRTAEQMKSLRATWPSSAAKQNAVFSWACYDHASSLSERGFDEQTCGANRTTLGMALKQYLGLSNDVTHSAPEFEWLDSCQGFACGSGCKSQVSIANGHEIIVV